MKSVNSNSDGEALLTKSNEGRFEISAKRWIVLLLYSLLGVMQSVSWNFYAPISGSIKEVYGWSDYDISFVENMANITFLIGTIPGGVFADIYGLRYTVLICGSLILLSCTLRIVPCDDSHHIYWVYTSMFFNGLGAAPLNFLGPVVSSTWFPISERATATSIASVACYMGQSVGFILGPLLVHKSSHNTKEQIWWLYFMETIITLFIFLFVLPSCIFPHAPPSPPSETALNKKEAFSIEGVKRVGRNQAFWFICLAFAIPTGIFSGWQPVLDLDLSKLGFTDTEAGWLGCFMTFFGCAGGIIFGFLSDRMTGRLKTLTFSLQIVATISFFWFAFSVNSILIPDTKTSIYISAILGGFCMNAWIPLFFELTMETIYPEPEGTANSILIFSLGIVQIIFLYIPPDEIGTSWMNWACGVSMPLSLVALGFTKIPYLRMKADLDNEPEIPAFESFGCFGPSMTSLE